MIPNQSYWLQRQGKTSCISTTLDKVIKSELLHMKQDCAYRPNLSSVNSQWHLYLSYIWNPRLNWRFEDSHYPSGYQPFLRMFIRLWLMARNERLASNANLMGKTKAIKPNWKDALLLSCVIKVDIVYVFCAAADGVLNFNDNGHLVIACVPMKSIQEFKWSSSLV